MTTTDPGPDVTSETTGRGSVSPSTDRGSAGRPRWRTAVETVGRVPARLRELAVVAVAVVALQVVTFSSYYSGAMAPQWDFQSAYTTEAFAWWHDGSFFNPPDWLPYLWGGYPSVVNLQNSSFYLPVGLASAVGPYDQHAAAIVSALHVALGAIGVYLFARLWGARPSAALTGLVLWHFAAGFYSNASHLDIMRAYAWLPWLLLVASPRWPWRRPWAPVAAVLILWQGILGTYPGILIATVYVGVVWVVMHQLTSRPRLRDYLLPLAAAGVLAVSMTALRFLPALLTRGAGIPGDGDVSAWSWNLIGTLWFSYADARIPNDITMRSLFLPAPALVAAAFVCWRRPLVRVTAVTAAVAVGLGMPGTPWAPLVSHLPGLDISRFRLSDFKPFVLFAIVVLAVMGIDRIVRRRRVRGTLGTGEVVSDKPLLTPVRVGYLVGLVVLAVAVGTVGPFLPPDWVAQCAFLAGTAVVLVLACTPVVRTQLRVLVSAVTLVAVASGLVWAFGTTVTWAVPRVPMEQLVFGAPVDQMIAARKDSSDLVQRPGRAHSVPLDIEPSIFDVFANGGGRAFYTGEIALDGYANLKGTPTFEAILASIQDPVTRADAWEFWLAPGIAIASDGGDLPTQAETQACVEDGDCGTDLSTAVSYDPSPEIEYHVTTTEPTDLSLNEAYYPGWVVEACDRGGAEQCVDIDVQTGTGGQLVATGLPAGDWTVRATYALPGASTSWLAFAAGTTLALAWGAALLVVHRRRRPATDVAGTSS